MCVICRNEYDETTTEIDCHGCRQVTEIPETLTQLKTLYCCIIVSRYREVSDEADVVRVFCFVRCGVRKIKIFVVQRRKIENPKTTKKYDKFVYFYCAEILHENKTPDKIKNKI